MTGAETRIRIGHRGGVRTLTVAVAVLALLAAGCSTSKKKQGGTCDQWVGRVIDANGLYYPSDEEYARQFAFGMKLNCDGSHDEIVTVQRSTGRLPVCQSGQPVTVTGKLVWNRTLVDGHYEMNNPEKVTCR